jgi:adenylate cyclase
MTDALDTALRRIASSETFRLAHQQRELLAFLVNRLANTPCDEFKESIIGMEFFGRRPGYDPKADPIVRVEAHRLRRRLEAYYRTEGSGDPWRIVLGKGNYVPAIQERPGVSSPNLLLAVFVSSDDELMSLGMAAEIIRNLGRLKNVRVLAPQSVSAADGDVGKAISELGATAVLECRISGANISAQLKRVVADGFELIGSFNNQIQSAVDMIGMFVASTLEAEHTGHRPRTQTQVDRETYQVYLSGRAWFLRWSPDNLTRAMEHFHEVLHRYPSYAPAYAGLADCQALKSWWHAKDTRKTLEQGYTWATKALELNPECGEAYCSLAMFQLALKHEWELAESNFHRAIRQNPSYSMGLNWLSIACLVPLSRFDEAIDAVFEAYDLDPVSPEVGNEIVWVRICCGQFTESAEQGRRMISQHPEFVEAYWSLGLAESALGNHEAARRALQAAEDLDPHIPHTIAWRGFVEGRAGNRGEAERYLGRLDEIRNKCPVRPVHYCWVYSGLGDIDISMDYFEKAVVEADPFTLYADVFPVYFNLHKHPRFVQSRRALGLPERQC